MCYVNYVRENIAFMEYASDERLSASEQLLWHALIHLMNQRANGSDWPEGFVSIPNARILFYAPFGEDTLTSARNRLKQRGLIDYVPGKKNKQAPQYKMIYFSAELSTDNAQNVGSFPEISDNARGNMHGNARGNMQGNAQGNSYGINVNLYGNPNRSPNVCAYEDDEDAAAEWDERSALEELIKTTFKQEIGREAFPAEARQIAFLAINLGMDQEVVIQSIGRAANMGAHNPAVYAVEVMRKWSEKNIHTIYELVESGCM